MTLKKWGRTEPGNILKTTAFYPNCLSHKHLKGSIMIQKEIIKALSCSDDNVSYGKQNVSRNEK